MKLSRLTALEQDKILLDYKELINSIKEYQLILKDNKVLMNLIRSELEEIKKLMVMKEKLDLKNTLAFQKRI